jgi:hypothetical protein
MCNFFNIKIMKNIKIVATVIVLAVVCISFRGLHHHKRAQHAEIAALFSGPNTTFEAQFINIPESRCLNPNNLVVIEVEEEINLGFDTAAYLPLGFNAYTGMDLEAQDLEVFESEEEVDLGFDTIAYLPAGFNAYAQ